MITASIVTYNTNIVELRSVLDCATKSIINKIYVVDNSSTDSLKTILCVYNGYNISYIQGQGNIGYGKAHNIALNLAKKENSKYHIVLNADIVFKPSTIDHLEAFMDSHPEVGEVMPKVYYPDGRLQYLAKLLPTPMDIIGRKFLPKSIQEKRNANYEMHSIGYDKVMNVPILSGCFMFLRMDAIRKVGGFDDSFFMYFEDFDLIRRIHKRYKTVFYPHVSIIHNHAAEHKVSKKLLKISIQSAIKYFNKWGWIFDADRRRINRHAFDVDNIIVEK